MPRSYQALSVHSAPRLLGATPRRLAANYRYGKGRRGLIAYPGLSATQRPTSPCIYLLVFLDLSSHRPFNSSSIIYLYSRSSLTIVECAIQLRPFYSDNCIVQHPTSAVGDTLTSKTWSKLPSSPRPRNGQIRFQRDHQCPHNANERVKNTLTPLRRLVGVFARRP